MMLEPSVIAEIARIGRERFPNEACGVLIPEKFHGRQVWELPNRSKTPRDSFTMTSDDVAMTLEDWIRSKRGSVEWSMITLWHTHPNGVVEPSKADVQNRIDQCGNLVVSLGDEPRATWF